MRAVKKDVKIEGEEKERLSAQSKVSKIMVLCPYESRRVTVLQKRSIQEVPLRKKCGKTHTKIVT